VEREMEHKKLQERIWNGLVGLIGIIISSFKEESRQPHSRRGLQCVAILNF
jgi:hypothetical protein